MPILHPIFAIIFAFLAFASYWEIFRLEKKQSVFVWIAGVLIIVAVGLRLNAGADYPVYRTLFAGFSLYTSYDDVFDKALFRPNAEEIEWLYVLINKVVFDFGLPFFVVTFICALIAVTLKFTTIYKKRIFSGAGAAFLFYADYVFRGFRADASGIGHCGVYCVI